MAVRADYAQAVADAAARVDNELIVVAQDGELATAARKAGLDVAIVGIVDRAYQEDGTLLPRSQSGAVLHDPTEIVDRTLRMVVDGKIRCATGVDINIDVDTLLLHGDNPGAVELARQIRSELISAGVRIATLAEVMDAKRKAA
ncbi:LamB/YcsF family protein [compost metagenome]